MSGTTPLAIIPSRPWKKWGMGICTRFRATPVTPAQRGGTRAKATSATASRRFIHGPAIETKMSSSFGLRRLAELTGTGLAQPTRKRATPGERKIISNGSATVPMGSM